MTLFETVDHIVDEYYPWAKPHGQNAWDKSTAPSDTLGQPAPDTLGQPAPTGTLGQPAPTDTLGQPAPSGQLGQGFQPVDQLGQPLPSLDAAPAPTDPVPAPTDPVTTPLGNFESFDLKVSNRRALPDSLQRISLLLDVTVNTAEVEHWCAINFQETSDLDNYIIHFHFNNYDQPIHFTQKYQKHWTQNASATTFTLKQASYEQSGLRKLRVAINWSDAEETYIFSFLGEDGQWLTHKYAPGYEIKYVYYNGWKHGEAPIFNDLRVTPLPALPK
ncbi:hypothetical protein TWF281_006201 [Arthrobotrys megalospora]